MYNWTAKQNNRINWLRSLWCNSIVVAIVVYMYLMIMSFSWHAQSFIIHMRMIRLTSLIRMVFHVCFHCCYCRYCNLLKINIWYKFLILCSIFRLHHQHVRYKMKKNKWIKLKLKCNDVIKSNSICIKTIQRSIVYIESAHDSMCDTYKLNYNREIFFLFLLKTKWSIFFEWW